MIAMTCSCGGEFWVRERLAGQATNCPACGKESIIPSADAIRSTTIPVACECGEVFRSASWRPGRLSKCPICGRPVGLGTTASVATDRLRSGRARGPSEPTLTPATGSGDEVSPATAADSPAVIGMPPPPTPTLWSRPAIIAAASAGIALLVIVAAVVALRAPSSSPSGGAAPQAAPGGVAEKPAAPVTPAAEGQAASRTSAVAHESARLKILVPAYFYPGGPTHGDWDRLIEAAARVPIVAVINPASGPGDSASPDYADVVRRGSQAGITFVGYVNTAYAKRPRLEVEADIDRWIQFYPQIRGIFFDAQASEARHVDHYAGLYGLVNQRISGALVVTNPGTICDEGYFARPATDVAILFEDSKGFDAFRLPPWAGKYDPRRFAAIPYGIPDKGRLRDAVHQVILQGMGLLYVTEGGLPNPWGRLAANWNDEVDAVQRVNERRAP